MTSNPQDTPNETTTHTAPACACSRRRFLGMAAFGATVVGAGATLSHVLPTLVSPTSPVPEEPLAVDISRLPAGQGMTVMWGGRPVFIRHRTREEITAARAVKLEDLRDPERDEDRTENVRGGASSEHTRPNADTPNDAGAWLVVIGVCTHLECVPLGQTMQEKRGDFGGWFCPCHGAHYDTSGRIRQGPAPKNLVVPPWSFVDAHTIVLGKRVLHDPAS